MQPCDPMTPDVSVVMPVRNGARWLRESVASVRSQRLSGLELLVIDDGSTDETPRILAEFAARDDRIRIIRQEPLGLVAALNRGLADARAPLLARLDSDDRARPERLERQARYLRDHPEVGLLGSWAEAIDAAGNEMGRKTPETKSDVLKHFLMRGNPFVHSSVMLRTQLARDLRGFRQAFRAAEDYDLWLRMAEVAEVANLPEILVDYRVHDAGVTNVQALRQAFSARLARRAARVRRETGHDPADGLADPPDWRSPEAAALFYADDARIYRLLDLADASASAGKDANVVDLAPLFAQFSDLAYAERTLATVAMLNHIRRASWPHALRTCGRLLMLALRRPGVVVLLCGDNAHRRPV